MKVKTSPLNFFFFGEVEDLPYFKTPFRKTETCWRTWIPLKKERNNYGKRGIKKKIKHLSPTFYSKPLCVKITVNFFFLHHMFLNTKYVEKHMARDERAGKVESLGGWRWFRIIHSKYLSGIIRKEKENIPVQSFLFLSQGPIYIFNFSPRPRRYI